MKERKAFSFGSLINFLCTSNSTTSQSGLFNPLPLFVFSSHSMWPDCTKLTNGKIGRATIMMFFC